MYPCVRERGECRGDSGSLAYGRRDKAGKMGVNKIDMACGPRIALPSILESSRPAC